MRPRRVRIATGYQKIAVARVEMAQVRAGTGTRWFEDSNTMHDLPRTGTLNKINKAR